MALQSVRLLYPGITQDSDINSGRPIIQRTRIFVDIILDELSSHTSTEDICSEYELQLAQVQAVQQLTPEQIQYIRGYADALENRHWA